MHKRKSLMETLSHIGLDEEITVNDLMARLGRTRGAAHRRLALAVREGCVAKYPPVQAARSNHGGRMPYTYVRLQHDIEDHLGA